MQKMPGSILHGKNMTVYIVVLHTGELFLFAVDLSQYIVPEGAPEAGGKARNEYAEYLQEILIGRCFIKALNQAVLKSYRQAGRFPEAVDFLEKGTGKERGILIIIIQDSNAGI